MTWKKILEAIFLILPVSMDYVAAVLWSERAGDEEARIESQSAIQWCLHAHDVDENSWRKDMRGSVIEPLRLCHQSPIS
jgi:hypothetical protein